MSEVDSAAPAPAPSSPPPAPPASEAYRRAAADALSRYWRKNVMISVGLLIIWAIVGLGCGVLFADYLNQFHIGGYPMGFFFAQQGSIVVFVLLILIYCVALNRLDRMHHEELARLRAEHQA